MHQKVLVGYATRNGSTAEAAQALAEALRAEKVDAEARPLSEVRSVESYAAVVMGAPLYMFKWHKDARAFLSRQRKALATLPVAVFSLGPVNDVEKEWTQAREQMDKELAGYPWLQPFARTVFGGKFSPTELGFPFTLLPALKKMPASDIRNLGAVKAWGAELAPLLRGR